MKILIAFIMFIVALATIPSTILAANDEASYEYDFKPVNLYIVVKDPTKELIALHMKTKFHDIDECYEVMQLWIKNDINPIDLTFTLHNEKFELYGIMCKIPGELA